MTLTVLDIIAENSKEIQKRAKLMSIQELNDLCVDINKESLHMIKLDGKTEKQAYELGLIKVMRDIKSDFYNPNFKFNYSSTIDLLIKNRKIVEKIVKQKFNESLKMENKN